MRVASLQSGSNGNCYVVMSGGVALFVDAGIPWKRARAGMETLGLTPESVAGLLLTHEHNDHSSHAGVFHRALGMPIHATQRTVDQIRRSHLRKVPEKLIRCFRPGERFVVGPFEVESFRVQHNAVDPVGYVVDDGRHRTGIITDLGRPTNRIRELMGTLDAVFIESNFDRDLLAGNSRYPELLKDRIRGWRGHLENRASATLVKHHASPRLRHVLLSHLSEDNNDPDLALATHRREWDNDLPLFDAPQLLIAPRNGPSPLIELGCVPLVEANAALMVDEKDPALPEAAFP
jgi:phosphoribosyl 1,2-cyclic phosphodiesterase